MNRQEFDQWEKEIEQAKEIEQKYKRKARRIVRTSIAGVVLGIAGMIYAATGSIGVNPLPTFAGNQYAKSAEVKVHRDLSQATLNLETARKDLVDKMYGINWEAAGQSADRYFDAVKTLKEARDSISEERDKLTLTDNFKAYGKESEHNQKYGLGIGLAGLLVAVSSLVIGSDGRERNKRDHYIEQIKLGDKFRRESQGGK